MEIGNDALDDVFPPLREVLQEALLPSLRLTVAGRCVPDSTDTRLGGVPLLAPGAAWPYSPSGHPQSFIGQLNSNDVNARLGTPHLPSDTLLSFFYDLHEERWGFDPADAGHWRVVATPVGEALPVTGPEEAESFEGHAVTAAVVRTVPERWEPPVEPVWAKHRDPVDAFYDAVDSSDDVPLHRVFGWPELVQNPMQLECQLASNGVYCGDPAGWRDPRVEDLKPGAADWVLLWQIDSDDAATWMWGDVGRLYYWIRRQDLAAGDFDRVWFIQQSC